MHLAAQRARPTTPARKTCGTPVLTYAERRDLGITPRVTLVAWIELFAKSGVFADRVNPGCRKRSIRATRGRRDPRRCMLDRRSPPPMQPRWRRGTPLGCCRIEIRARPADS